MSEKTFNAALVKELCIVCAKEMDGPIIINKVLTKKNAAEIEQMHGKVIGFAETPCDECKENLDKAFMIISIDEEKSNFENLPEGFYRTGKLIGVRKDSKLVTELIQERDNAAFKRGFCFMDENVMEHIGLLQEIN